MTDVFAVVASEFERAAEEQAAERIRGMLAALDTRDPEARAILEGLLDRIRKGLRDLGGAS